MSTATEHAQQHTICWKLRCFWTRFHNRPFVIVPLVHLSIEPSPLILESIAGFNYLMTTNPPPNSTVLKPSQHRFVARCVTILPLRPQDALAQERKAEFVQNRETAIVRNTGQNESRHGKYKTLKLGVGQIYYRSSDVTAVANAK
jgi:hypothetical protein